MTAPAKELFSNNKSTTLSGGVNNSVTSITATDGSVFPATGDFRLICGTELMLCTARSSNTLTVQRGAEGSTAASHADLDPITHIVTAGAVVQHGRDNDPLWNSSRPALGKLVADNGTTILTASDFTDVNAGTGSKTDQDGTILLTKPGHVGPSVYALVRSAPSTPYTYISCFEAIAPLGAASVDRPNFGLVFRESSTGKLTTFDFSSEAGTGQEPILWRVSNRASPTAGPSNAASARLVVLAPRLWMKAEDDGTNLKWYVSMDGFNWAEIYSVGRTTHMAGGPDQIGWYADNADNDKTILIRLCHFSKG